VEIIVQYIGVPADGLRIGATKFGDRSFFNENWPNRARHWLPVVDHPYDKATSEFIVKAPVHYQVVSNGLLMEETILDSKTKLTHWKQSIPVSSWLFVLGVAEFAVQYIDVFEGKSIQTWVYNKDRASGFYDFAEPTKHVVEFFSDYVGPYQYEKIANVQTPSVKGGMETSSAIFYDENLIDGKYSVRLRNIVIHELAHQWFGNAVTETTWDESWLSEGFATYFTMLFIEHAYGREEFVSQLESAKKIAMKFIAENPDYKIIDDRSPEKTSVTSSLTYQKGAWVLHMLRNKIGDTSFKKGIQNYYHQYLNANATTDDFRKCMENVSGQNLESFFNQWLKQGSALSIQGSWRYDEKKKTVSIQLKQTQSANFSFDLQVGIYTSGKTLPEVSSQAVTSKDFEIVIPSATRPEKVVLDPKRVLFASTELKESK
jgi:aminopeptidase N